MLLEPLWYKVDETGNRRKIWLEELPLDEDKVRAGTAEERHENQRGKQRRVKQWKQESEDNENRKR